MGIFKAVKKLLSNKKLIALTFTFGLLGSLFAIAQFKDNKATPVEAADYSGVSGGFTHGSDGSISASFTVTNNNLDMKGWLLCLFESKPSVDSNNKLTNSNDAHPYSYSAVKHYFFAANTAKTGSITVTWAANSADQKQNWTASTSSGATGQTLKDYVENGTNWHLVIGPRHYNTSWGDSGIGAGTNGYWENCDYYVGSLTEVFPDESKDMSVSVTNYEGTYNNANHSIKVKVNDPSSGYTIKYRTASSGSYDLTTNPEYKNAGTYTVYFEITSSGYNAYHGSGTVKINKANASYNAPYAVSGLKYNGNEQNLVNAGSSNVLYSLDGESYSADVPKGKDAGKYTVYYKVEETTNYKALDPKTIEVTIAKANPTYTAPTNKSDLVYNGSNQALVNAGSSNVLYSLDGESYSEDVPTAKNAGEYVVYYKVEETSNYKGLDPQSIEVSIAKANATYITVPSAKLGLNYIGESQALVNAGSNNGGVLYYSLDGETYSTSVPEKVLVGTYTVYYKIEGDNNYNGVDASSIEVSIYPNDKTALNAAIIDVTDYYEGILEDYPSIANELNSGINSATLVSEDDNQTVEEIANAKIALIGAYDLAHAQISDYLINAIGDVRYSDRCLEDILEAEGAYASLSEEQKDLVNNHDDLVDARELYDKLEDVAEVINAIGEVAYDNDSLVRIEAAQEAFNTLSEDEQLLIPTLFNDLNSAQDVYNMLKLIANLGEVEYSEAYLERLESARNAYDALDYNEQKDIATYQELLDAEEAYYNVDKVVNLVNSIAEELEYVGTHNFDIEKARKAYDSLSEEEKLLVPDVVKAALEEAEEEYEELKVEHERKEIEDREAGVVIATEGGSGIPNTVSIDINNSQNKDQDFENNIDYQTLQETISEEEAISSICEIKFYEEVNGEIVERSLADIDENMSVTIKIDVPLDVDDTNFKIVLLDEDNNTIEMAYTYDPVTRQATVTSKKIGTFAIITPVKAPTVAKDGLPLAILLAVLVSLTILGFALVPTILKRMKKK